jgi:iron complex outermembrane recepter protein
VFEPRFIQGFTASIDYYHIKINDVITTPGSQTELNNCYAGVTSYCQYVFRSPTTGLITSINQVPQNLNEQITYGYDIEAGYTLPLARTFLDAPGALSFRFLGTHVISDRSISGTVVTELAGVNDGTTGTGLPSWRTTFTVNYQIEQGGVSVTERTVSPGVYSNLYIQCSSACPAHNSTYQTINDNQVAGAVYTDLNLRYDTKVMNQKSQLELFLTVQNLFNKSPPIAASGPGGLFFLYFPANPSFYDTLGRQLRAGFTLTMD